MCSAILPPILKIDSICVRSYHVNFALIVNVADKSSASYWQEKVKLYIEDSWYSFRRATTWTKPHRTWMLCDVQTQSLLRMLGSEMIILRMTGGMDFLSPTSSRVQRGWPDGRSLSPTFISTNARLSLWVHMLISIQQIYHQNCASCSHYCRSCKLYLTCCVTPLDCIA